MITVPTILSSVILFAIIWHHIMEINMLVGMMQKNVINSRRNFSRFFRCNMDLNFGSKARRMILPSHPHLCFPSVCSFFLHAEWGIKKHFGDNPSASDVPSTSLSSLPTSSSSLRNNAAAKKASQPVELPKVNQACGTDGSGQFCGRSDGMVFVLLKLLPHCSNPKAEMKK